LRLQLLVGCQGVEALRLAANGIGNVGAADADVLKQPVVQGQKFALGPTRPSPVSKSKENAAQDQF